MDQAASDDRLMLALLIDFRSFEERPGESPVETAERWLAESPLGRRLAEYLGDETSVLASASAVLSSLPDTDLRELGTELEKSARRLDAFVGNGSPPRA